MIFSEEELTAISTGPGDLGLSALRSGDSAAALAIAKQSINAHFPVRDIYTSWNGLTLNFVAQRHGRAVLETCLTEGLRTVIRPWAEWFRNGLSREAVSQFAQICRMDAGLIDAVVETKDSIRFTLSDWMGVRWRELPDAADFSIVRDCVQRLCIEWLGYPPFALNWEKDSNTLDLIFYKDPLAVPTEVFEGLGVSRDATRIATAFSVSGVMLFDETEREAMRYQAHERAAQCLERGELELAERHFCLSKTEWYLAHHFIRDWVTGMTTWLHREYGAQEVWDCVDETYNKPTMGAMLANLANIEARDQVQLLAGIFHQHGMKFQLLETEAGIEFKTAPCGSGGRLIDELAYDGPKNFSTVEGNSRLSFGMDEMPVYCMHCPGTNKIILEGEGPYFALVDPDIDSSGKLRGHCSFHIYHREADIPDHMYSRIGLQRRETSPEPVKLIE